MLVATDVSELMNKLRCVLQFEHRVELVNKKSALQHEPIP